jgi:UDP-N-acetylmuramoyl-L-alanyl-D-glutamate--2,6-diaminopimelate ligase
MSLKSCIRKIIPEKFLLHYHNAKSFIAGVFYGKPTKDILVIGITGTKGKSTTANFVWSVLQAGGMKTGLIGTANIRIGEKEMMNKYHMTMPSPFVLQKFFAQMKKEGCKAIVMEVTSEGIKQHRQKNIDFDIGMFTNLSPEHLPSHNNSFEEYKNTKKRFFSGLSQKASVIVNMDDEHSDFFLDTNVAAGEKITTSLKGDADYVAAIISVSDEKTVFRVGDNTYEIFVGGTKNVENALLAIALGVKLHISPENIQKGFAALTTIPGRMEKISGENPQSQNFSVFVDYAHEEQSMNFLMDTGVLMKKNLPESARIIVLLGAEGGGRDPRKRPIMGKIVAEKADIVVVSNVDPYEDDPTEICEDIAQAAEKNGKEREKNLFVIEDRRAGIAKCLSLAKSGDGDIVFITGKGSEQSIVIGGVSSSWDDRRVVEEELKKCLYDKNR